MCAASPSYAHRQRHPAMPAGEIPQAVINGYYYCINLIPFIFFENAMTTAGMPRKISEAPDETAAGLAERLEAVAGLARKGRLGLPACLG